MSKLKTVTLIGKCGECVSGRGGEMIEPLLSLGLAADVVSIILQGICHTDAEGCFVVPIPVRPGTLVSREFLFVDCDNRALILGGPDELGEYMLHTGYDGASIVRLIADFTGEYPPVEEIGDDEFIKLYGFAAYQAQHAAA